MAYIIYETLMLVFRIIETVVLVRVILSWVMPMSRINGTIDWLLSPLLMPFRKLSMKLTARFQIPLDFSYMFLLVAIEVARGLAARLLIMAL